MLYIKTNNYKCLKVFSAYWTLLVSLALLPIQTAIAGSQSIMITVSKGFGLSLYASDLGEIGEVITPNARAFSNIPLTIAYKGQLIIRGEAEIGRAHV